MASNRVGNALGGSGYIRRWGQSAPTPSKPTGWGGLMAWKGSADSARRPGAAAAAAAPAPASPAPGPAPAAGSAALPVDPVYDAQIGAYGKTRDDTLADLGGQRTSGLSSAGYTATYDDKGNVAGLTYDPNNPYSQAALARTVYQQSKTGTGNSMAARGQLYSGALINAQNQNDTNYNVGENGRQTSLIRFLNGITSGENRARNDYGTNFATAGADRLGRAPTNPNYTPSDANAGAAPAPAAAPSGPTVNGKPLDLSKWITTESKNAQGHPVRAFGDGHREVFVNGAWKRV